MIGPRKIVSLEYTLRSDDGELIDSSEGQHPLVYLHGANQIVPGLERALEGLTVGAERDVVVKPEEGYGLPDPGGVFTVPRVSFPPELELSVGDQFMAENDDGGTLQVRVVELRDDVVVVDANHPLAGVTLHFHIAVKEVRDATPDELLRGGPAEEAPN